MLTEMQDETGRTATAQVNAMRRAIEQAIAFFQSTRFFFNETRSATFNTVVGTDTYAFNTATTTGAIAYEFFAIDGVWVTFGTGDVREMDIVDYTDIEQDADNQTANNQPTAVAYIGKALRFDYAPIGIYSTRIAGHYSLAGPATDNEADNPWMTEAYYLIKSRAKGQLYAHRWEDYVSATTMQQAEAVELRSLQAVTFDKIRTGSIRPSADF